MRLTAPAAFRVAGHYYGDVAEGVTSEQVQILEPLWMEPFQMLCCACRLPLHLMSLLYLTLLRVHSMHTSTGYFGSTHWIHHFVVRQPFWVRTVVAFNINKRVNGPEWQKATKGAVRYNDLGVFASANRRNATPNRETQSAGSGD